MHGWQGRPVEAPMWSNIVIDQGILHCQIRQEVLYVVSGPWEDLMLLHSTSSPLPQLAVIVRYYNSYHAHLLNIAVQ